MINELQKEHDPFFAIVSLKKKIVTQLLKVVTEKRSKRKLHKLPIRNQLEAIILLYKVQQSSYHGCDFIDGNLRNLFNNAEEVFKNSKQMKSIAETKSIFGSRNCKMML